MSYNEDNSKVTSCLNDINLIRKRPIIFFGSNDKCGVISAIKRLVAFCMPFSDTVEIEVLDDNVLILDFKDLDVRFREFWLNLFVAEDFLDKNRDIIAYCVFRATCDYMKVYLCREYEGEQDYRYYKDGKLVEKRMSYKEDMKPFSLRIEYKPSKEVFNFDLISKEDLDFLRVK